MGQVFNLPFRQGGESRQLILEKSGRLQTCPTFDFAINSAVSKGRALDNVMIERLWCPVKYEEVYRKEFATGAESKKKQASYFDYYGHERRVT